MVRRRKLRSEARPEARAKRVRRENRSEFVVESFVNKLKEMRVILADWRSKGRPEGSFWPDTKVALREWHNPEKGIFRWGSPNIDSPNGPNRDLVKEWESLRAEALLMPVGVTDLKAENDQLKKINRKLGEQLATRTYQVMELLDAIATLDNNHHLLSKFSLKT
jgi:hypothetical protein